MLNSSLSRSASFPDFPDPDREAGVAAKERDFVGEGGEGCSRASTKSSSSNEEAGRRSARRRFSFSAKERMEA